MGKETATVHLVIPGLLDRVREWCASYGGVGRYPDLESLLDRSRVLQGADQVPESILASQFGLSGPVPAGALTRLALTGDTDPGPWICVDPVHLEPGIADLVLADPAELALEVEESRALVERINEHMAAEGLLLECTASDHWHMRLPDAVPLPRTYSLSQVQGRAVSALLPKGPAGLDWHRIINEMQMILFDAPQNQVRETQGRPTVNSVWPWGAGRLPGAVRSPASRIYGDSPLLAGLARCAGMALNPLPEAAACVLEHGGSRLVYLDILLGDTARDDMEAWQASMEGLERNWFAPLRRALGSAQLNHLVIHGGLGAAFSVAPGTRWRFWRKPQPLTAFVP